MKIEYQLKRLSDPGKREETIRDCEKGRKAFQNMIVLTAKHSTTSRIAIAYVWAISRFFRRKVTDESICYDFYLFP